MGGFAPLAKDCGAGSSLAFSGSMDLAFWAFCPSSSGNAGCTMRVFVLLDCLLVVMLGAMLTEK